MLFVEIPQLMAFSKKWEVMVKVEVMEEDGEAGEREDPRSRALGRAFASALVRSQQPKPKQPPTRRLLTHLLATACCFAVAAVGKWTSTAAPPPALAPPPAPPP